MTTDRIDDLESRIAFQEDAINQLSDTLFRQQQQIERLERRLRSVDERVQSLGEQVDQPSTGHEPPPHY